MGWPMATLIVTVRSGSAELDPEFEQKFHHHEVAIEHMFDSMATGQLPESQARHVRSSVLPDRHSGHALRRGGVTGLAP